MRPVKDLAELGQRIAATHGWAAARAFKAYNWDERDRACIAACASEILKIFPKDAGTERLLTTALAMQLGRRLEAPVYLVAGTLRVQGLPVLGGPATFDGATLVDPDADDWHGHLWIMIGAHVIDVALFRLVNRTDCPPDLARHVHSVFGSDKGLYADHWRRARKQGLDYEPRYILNEADSIQLMTAAYHLMQPETHSAEA